MAQASGVDLYSTSHTLETASRESEKIKPILELSVRGKATNQQLPTRCFLSICEDPHSTRIVGRLSTSNRRCLSSCNFRTRVAKALCAALPRRRTRVCFAAIRQLPAMHLCARSCMSPNCLSFSVSIAVLFQQRQSLFIQNPSHNTLNEMPANPC